MKFAAFFVVLAMSLSACGGTSSARSLSGTWTSYHPHMVAHIRKGKIRIDFVDSGERSLYWKGTFNVNAHPGSTQISKGDTKAMDKSILGSLDSTKKFTYANGQLSFRFTILGTTKTIYLKR